MPLPSGLLAPISHDRPGGESLRYSTLYDKIKEARREEADLPQGEWQRERKIADWPLTVWLIGQALATRSKDLQLAVWLAEAMLHEEGLSGLRETLDLIRDLIEEFWDVLYPELEDGDADLRAAPLSWLGRSDAVEIGVRFLPLTQGGLAWVHYWQARSVGSAAEADSWEKKFYRQAAIAEGKLTKEQFEEDFDATPVTFYSDLEASLAGTLASLDHLSGVCAQRFGDARPDFRWLRRAIEEVRQTVHGLLVKKSRTGAVGEPEPKAEEPTAPTGKPQDAEDANARIVAGAHVLRRLELWDPAPYLLLRALRWGQLRVESAYLDRIWLAAPSAEVRFAVEDAAAKGSWTDLLEAAETAMGMACGCGWLDLQFYVARACSKLGHLYEPIRRAVILALQALLTKYPKLPALTLSDGTPTADPQTLEWIQRVVVPWGKAKAAAVDDAAPPPMRAEPTPPMDASELAIRAVLSGNPQEGIELLMRGAVEEPSGRKRFERKVLVAQISMGWGIESVALPLLRELAAEIELRKLEEWEPPELVARPLAMLYRCLANHDGTEEELRKLEAWIGSLDPTALHVEK